MVKKRSIINKLPLIAILSILILILGFTFSNCGKGPPTKTLGPRGAYAVKFDGVTGSIGMQTISFSKSFDYRNTPITAEAWIKADPDKLEGTIVKTGDKENGFFLYHATGTARFGIISGGQICANPGDNCIRYPVDSGVTVNDGEWHHVAGVLGPDIYDFDSDSNTTEIVIRIYVDGILRNTASAGYITGLCETGDMIGWDEAAIVEENSDYTFKGIIDEVRIWKEARTTAQIVAGMNTEITGDNWHRHNPNSTLKSYWTFNEGKGKTVYDVSGNDPSNNGAFESCIKDCGG